MFSFMLMATRNKEELPIIVMANPPDDIFSSENSCNSYYWFLYLITDCTFVQVNLKHQSLVSSHPQTSVISLKHTLQVR